MENKVARSSPLLRTLEILDYLTRQREAMTAQQIADATGVSRATVYRTLEELTLAGWLAAAGSPQRYAPAIRVVELGLRPLRRNYVRELLLPHMYELTDAVGCTTMISFYDRGDSVSTDGVERVGNRLIANVRGHRVPAPVSAGGKVLLAYQPDDEIERVASRGVPKFTEATKTKPEEIRDEIQRTRSQGYGVQDREYTPSSGGIACPVFDRNGEVVAAIAVGGSPTPEFVASVLEPTLAIALRASIGLGYRPPSQVEVA